MGSRIEPRAALVAFGITDERISPDAIDTALSTYTEAGPHPGVGVPSSERSTLGLQLSGEQDRELVVTAW